MLFNLTRQEPKECLSSVKVRALKQDEITSSEHYMYQFQFFMATKKFEYNNEKAHPPQEWNHFFSVKTKS